MPSYTEALFLSIDGNHGLRRKKNKGNSGEAALSNGLGYFPDDKKYKDYLSKAADDLHVMFAYSYQSFY